MIELREIHVHMFDGKFIHRGMIGYTVRDERTHVLLCSGFAHTYLEAQDRVLDWARAYGWKQIDDLGVSPSPLN